MKFTAIIDKELIKLIKLHSKHFQLPHIKDSHYNRPQSKDVHGVMTTSTCFGCCKKG